MFAASVEVDSAFRLSGNEGADGVDDGKCWNVVFLSHHDSAMSVFGFARLRNNKKTRVRWSEVMRSDFGGVDDLNGVEGFQGSHR